MATIRDVARLAGVAPATVSRVINDHDNVRPETRERVEQAIRELAYIPNDLGPSLRGRRTGTLALVVTDITNPFWTWLARGVEDAANRQGHHIIIGNTDESPAKQSEYIDFLLRKQVDGFVLVPASSRTIDPLLRQGRPVVLVDRTVPDVEVDTVRGDSEGGAYELVSRLLQLGHERVTMIAGPREASTSTERVMGYERALAEAGLEGSRRVLWGPFSADSAREQALKALDAPAPPTAFFAANNFICLGIMRALGESGLRVPEDVSVVSFDEVALQITVDPFFTVAVQPEYEMGWQATELLLARLAGTGPDTVQDVVLPSRIIERQSTAPPPGRRAAEGSHDH